MIERCRDALPISLRGGLGLGAIGHHGNTEGEETMNQVAVNPEDERDMTALILQNRRLVNLLATMQKQLVRQQHQRLQDAVTFNLLRNNIDEELKRSGTLLSKIETG